jgi:CRP-like cAMP-binding protein
MHRLLQDIASHNITLDQKEQELLLSLFEFKSYKAKTIILKEGEICNYIYILNKGIIRNYICDKNNKEYLFRIAAIGNFISSVKSFLKQTPSDFYIDVLEDAEVMQLSFENFELLTQGIPKMERYFRILISDQAIEFADRIKDNLTLTAEENYIKFTKKFPNLVNHITQKYIASYIGVTPAFFSRMKAKMLKK